MLTLPFRLAASLFIALFLASRLVRRAVAGVVLAAAIVASQHGSGLDALASATQAEPGLAQILIALASAVSEVPDDDAGISPKSDTRCLQPESRPEDAGGCPVAITALRKNSGRNSPVLLRPQSFFRYPAGSSHTCPLYLPGLPMRLTA